MPDRCSSQRRRDACDCARLRRTPPQPWAARPADTFWHWHWRPQEISIVRLEHANQRAPSQHCGPMSRGSCRSNALTATIPPADAPRTITLGAKSRGAASNIAGAYPTEARKLRWKVGVAPTRDSRADGACAPTNHNANSAKLKVESAHRAFMNVRARRIAACTVGRLSTIERAPILRVGRVIDRKIP